MLNWLKRRFKRPGTRGARRPAAPPAVRREVAAELSLEGVDPSFAPYARALGVALPPAATVTEADALEDHRVVIAVLEHYRQNRPRLAPPPTLSLRIMGLAIQPHAGAAELVPLIQNDSALAASVLRVANSTYYRATEEIESIRDAVVRLGMTEASRLAGALALRTLFNPRLKQELSTFGSRCADEFHRAIAVAGVSASLAMKVRGACSDRAYVGGILADASKAVALRSLHALMMEGVVALNVGEPQLDRVLETAHVEIGREAQTHWKLPSYLGDVCARIHEDELPASPELIDVHVVRLVSALEDLRRGAARSPRASIELVQSARALGVTPQSARTLLTDLRASGERAARTFAAGPPGAAPIPAKAGARAPPVIA